MNIIILYNGRVYLVVDIYLHNKLPVNYTITIQFIPRKIIYINSQCSNGWHKN